MIAALLAVLLAVLFVALFIALFAALSAARSGALPFAAESVGDRVVGFVVEAVLADDPSSAPQPFNAIVAKANSVALAMSVAFVMSASGSVKADAVSNRFEK
ncbi:hypothetical protein [Paraburkholderia sp.]|uniref:hypothetical protein n=1 Tax=Paraburkholderia sp. TaxID=1926495 RepID=UPI002F4268A2